MGALPGVCPPPPPILGGSWPCPPGFHGHRSPSGWRSAFTFKGDAPSGPGSWGEEGGLRVPWGEIPALPPLAGGPGGVRVITSQTSASAAKPGPARAWLKTMPWLQVDPSCMSPLISALQTVLPCTKRKLTLGPAQTSWERRKGRREGGRGGGNGKNPLLVFSP